MAPFRDELSEVILLDLIGSQVAEGAYFADRGTKVWNPNLDNPNRTAQDAARDARALASAHEANRTRDRIAKLEASIVYDGEGSPVGARAGVRLPDDR